MIKELWILVKMLFGKGACDIEEVLVIEMNHFPFKGYKAMSWCGHIIHRKNATEVDSITLLHETGHLKQAKLFDSWTGYYLSYLWNWMKHNPITKPSSAAYYCNKYEVQAYAQEENLQYWEGDIRKDLDGKYSIKNAKKLYKQLGGTSAAWKNYIKSL